MATATAACRKAALGHISSIGFSGAGFLACYHLGVAECLLEQKILTRDHTNTGNSSVSGIILTGVSGGALCAAAMVAGVSPQDGMQSVLHIAQQTTKQGPLDALTPGYSLIDQVQDVFYKSLSDAIHDDDELLQARLQGGKLRIGFTDRRILFSTTPPFRRRRNDAYMYVDEFRNVQDIVAACLLSSYVPCVTGPAWGSLATTNLAVQQSQTRMVEMMELGFIKHGTSGDTVQPTTDTTKGLVDGDILWFRNRECYWDGGLVNVWPVVDESTIIVTPISANFSPNPCISPAIESEQDENDDEGVQFWRWLVPSTLKVKEGAELHLSRANLETLCLMTLSSDQATLQERFAQGYSNAKRFLQDHNLLSVYSTSGATSKLEAVQ